MFLRTKWLYVQIPLLSLEVCIDCQYLMQKAVSLNDVVIASVRENDYKIIFWYMSKDEVINLLRKADLTEKSRT